jgi:uncharacterized protein (TIGR02145 family)
MKKLLTLLIGITLIYSCSTSSDGNGNSTTNVVPLAPTGLTGTVDSATQINLSWTDNSTNETGFKIERRTGVANYAVVGTVNQDLMNFSDSGLAPNTTYAYRIYSYNAVGNSLTYSNEVIITTDVEGVLPTLTTATFSSVTQTTATSGGYISNDGGTAITARGVCWSIFTNPDIFSFKTTDGSGIGAFTSYLSGLTANTTYHLRAYATNNIGTAYGNEVVFTTFLNSNGINILGPNLTDIDGNTYLSVTNCGQTWTKQNLNVSKYTDGTLIPQVTDPTQWANLTTGAWCYYNNDPANGAIYGKLYNYYAVVGKHDNDSFTPNKILAPLGWHIPSDDEWTQLTNCLGGYNAAGGRMKSVGTSLWESPNTSATNESGFTGLPGGYCGYTDFLQVGVFSFWWSITGIFSSDAWYRKLTYENGSIERSYDSKTFGFSVRCVKD